MKLLGMKGRPGRSVFYGLFIGMLLVMAAGLLAAGLDSQQPAPAGPAVLFTVAGLGCLVGMARQEPFTIHGAIRYGGRVYRAGDEEVFLEAVADQKDARLKPDFERLKEVKVISGSLPRPADSGGGSEAGDPRKQYEAQTVEQLRPQARDLGVEDYEKLRKADLITAIMEAAAKAEAGE